MKSKEWMVSFLGDCLRDDHDHEGNSPIEFTWPLADKQHNSQAVETRSRLHNHLYLHPHGAGLAELANPGKSNPGCGRRSGELFPAKAAIVVRVIALKDTMQLRLVVGQIGYWNLHS
ncbi:hypothetical protein Q3G72_034444 [Acer saccharum]|nr:hypothetical protein Q3G72_034444 [Acer saccharum]